jgi:hypothetical protein
LEPKARVIKRSQIPAARPLNLNKGYWDSVIRRAAEIGKDQALELFFSGGRSPISLKSSIHRAAARMGKRLAILIRGAKAYVWITGDQAPTRSNPSREPLKCLVCGKPIVRPKFGGGRQIVHASKGNKKSECQKVRRYAKAHDVSIAVAKERLGFKTD